MKKILLTLFLFYFFGFNSVFCEVISGKIDHNDVNYKNKIIDSTTQKGLAGAKISIPEARYTTYSDSDGNFKLNVDLTDKTVLFIEKDGYKTFSLTVDNSVIKNPLKLGIEKSNPFDMQITQGVVRLGDNMFSPNSANSREFSLGANGAFFSYKFNKPAYAQNQDVVVQIGTIIGLDTKKAKSYGQNRIAKVYSSPTEVFVNGHKIGNLELNGDNIEILIPKSILKIQNELVIKAGRNLFQTDYTDYDDIELANVRIEIKEHSTWARK